MEERIEGERRMSKTIVLTEKDSTYIESKISAITSLAWELIGFICNARLSQDYKQWERNLFDILWRVADIGLYAIHIKEVLERENER